MGGRKNLFSSSSVGVFVVVVVVVVDNLEQTFESNLNRIGKVIALFDHWENVKYLTRIWTIFEQFTAAKLNIPVDIVLPVGPAKLMMEQVERGKAGISHLKESL